MPVYMCPRCHIITNKKLTMTNHINRNLPCYKQFSDINLDINNLDKYIIKTPFCCGDCNKSFTSKWYLDVHKKDCKIKDNEDDKYDETYIKDLEQHIENLEKYIKQKNFVETTNELKETIKIIEEKKKKNKLSAVLRYKVWNTYIGIECGIGKCCCCKTTDIFQQSFECGHIIAVKNGGLDSIENLRPICSLCNKSMGSLHMEIFSSSLFI